MIFRVIFLDFDKSTSCWELSGKLVMCIPIEWKPDSEWKKSSWQKRTRLNIWHAVWSFVIIPAVGKFNLWIIKLFYKYTKQQPITSIATVSLHSAYRGQQ